MPRFLMDFQRTTMTFLEGELSGFSTKEFMPFSFFGG